MITPKRMQEMKRLASEAREPETKSIRLKAGRYDRMAIALMDLISEVETCDKRHAQIPIVNSPEWIGGLCERAMNLINRLKDTAPIFAYQHVAGEIDELSRYIATRAVEGRIAVPLSCEKRCLGCLDAKFPHNPDCPEG